MRRIVALAIAVGLFASGLGCKHVAGTCDCNNNPDNGVYNPPPQPYPALGQPVRGTSVPEKVPAPPPVVTPAPGVVPVPMAR